MRRAETADIFRRDDGRLLAAGDWFRQPALAQTLHRVAEVGAEHFYEGDWAREFVDVVGSEGGTVTMRDLGEYRPLWTEPVRGSFAGCEVFGPGEPDDSGFRLLEALNLATEAGLVTAPDYLASGEDLLCVMRIARERWHESGVASRVRATPEHARGRWSEIRRAALGRDAGSAHSDSVVAVDAEGHVAALTHTINTDVWGGTGLFVEGVSIPDAASRLQRQTAQVGPGQRLPNPLLPVIAVRAGRPVLASSAVGSGIHEVTFQGVLRVLGHGVPVSTAACGPMFHAPAFDVECDPDDEVPQYVAVEDFEPSVLDQVEARGLRLERRALDDVTWRGYWTAIGLTAYGDAHVEAVSSPCVGAWAEGVDDLRISDG